MSSSSCKTAVETVNPLDLIEEIFDANDWVCERFADEELLAELAGRWTTYRFGFIWREDLSALCCSCLAELPPSKASKEQIYQLLAQVNEKLWLGHFDFLFDESALVFRYTLLMRPSMSLGLDQLEELLDTMITDCDRFYPAFNFVVTQQKDVEEALTASVTETLGEA